MLKRIVQLFIVITGGTIGYLYFPELFTTMGLTWQTWIQAVMGAVIGALILFLLTFWIVDYIVDFIRWVEDSLVRAPVADLLFGSLGLIVGLLIAYLINVFVQDIQIQVINQVVPIALTVLLGYLGFQVGFKRKDEFLNLVSKKEKKAEDETEGSSGASVDESLIPKQKILDTSVIIDGRIADICETHFLEGTIVIPQFVLEELQHIADSSDGLKRNRGRRGLDILNRLQKDLPVNVEIYEGDFEDIQEVDSKLVKLAKVTDGIVVTNDFNLNKVCEFQNVQVLNINDLANAVKPVVLPGEEMTIQVIKDGKEQNQGVAYLDDGTMIVVEEGKDFIGKTIEVVVTSVLQTSAGRMIFAKPKSLEKAL
ncbi:TRAM domain-containing protein [Halobacillus litoralis]|uniref:asparaginase n=1 Tax=Halobacillus litoralis TaxID=45668 RepID=A0A845DX29_9BACI|nr:PIN/TRAM domain-containing protein [Halobacillus litoralis]MCA1024380.1 PIN/TRAM domain-containing protein [Halobacillus litoralis]MYL21936.1 TRAM domain-containing protein [Halobacillus litoralis]MYL31902.1 TRAM domain-containing protein [Halobacillus halophilus]MYL39736.1 TRAM domain-containing protein [Halobacillus litoralis]